MFNNIPKDILILTLQLTIMKNAMMYGWSVRRLNDKQIEITKKWNKNEDYNKICCDMLFHNNELFTNY